jgi:hypothetical protein
VAQSQFLQVAQSDAMQPTIIGFLTGSTEEMATSTAYAAVLKHLFNIKTLGLKWATINIKNPPKNQSWKDRKAAQIEIDASDEKTNRISAKLIAYFNKSSRDPVLNFMGTPMMFVPMTTGWQNSPRMAARVRTQIIGQASLVTSLETITLDNVNLTNAIDDAGTTLLQALISTSSIKTKTNKNGKNIIGRLFHSITPTEFQECYSVSYFQVNSQEATSVLSALPLFIEETWNISPSTFCRTCFINSAKEGVWESTTRVFKSKEDLEYASMLADIIDLADTPEEIVVLSSDHQKAMAMTEEDAATQATDLRNKAPKPVTDDLSALTGSTRTSKAEEMTILAVQAVQRDHLLAMQEQATSHAAALKELQDLRLQLLASTQNTPQGQQPRTLTPESARHGPNNEHDADPDCNGAKDNGHGPNNEHDADPDCNGAKDNEQTNAEIAHRDEADTPMKGANDYSSDADAQNEMGTDSNPKNMDVDNDTDKNEHTKSNPGLKDGWHSDDDGDEGQDVLDDDDEIFNNSDVEDLDQGRAFLDLTGDSDDSPRPDSHEEFDDSDDDIDDSPVQKTDSPYRKGRDKKATHPGHPNPDARYALRSRAATTTGGPGSGSHP